MSSTNTQIAVRDGSKSILAVMLAATPLYLYSTQARSKLGLDTLHLSLIQVVLLLIFGQLSNWSPPKRAVAAITNNETVLESLKENGSATSSASATQKVKAKKRNIKKKAKKQQENTLTHKLFPASSCDRVVRNFLAATEPEYVKLLPAPSPEDEELAKNAPESMPLSDWKELFKDEQGNLIVRQHPSANKLFALEAKFPNVPIRNLFEILTTIDKRKEYDGMTQDAKEIERFEIVDDGVGGKGKREIKGAAVWLAMKGMGPIKSKDMVLLSIAGRLPVPTPSSADELSADSKQEKMRMYCATSSFEHPDYPPQSGFNRMQMGVTGFLIEEDGNGGSNIVQVTDLSGLGSWVPGAVIRTVTQTMLPKTLYKLGKVAANYDVEKSSKYSVDGDDWIPPLLGLSNNPKVEEKVKAAGSTTEAAGDDDESDEEEDDDDSETSSLADSHLDASGSKHALSASSSRALHNLVSQLKTVTSRLSALEQQAPNSANKKWYSSLIPGTDQGLLVGNGGSNVMLLTTIGGAAGAALAMSLMRAWEKRRS